MRSFRCTICLCGLAMLLAACSTGSKPARFYLLTPMDQSHGAPAPTASQETPTIGIGPVSFPDYLLRPPIATFASANELRYAEFDRWAEPLGDNFSRVLLVNISDHLGSDHIVTYPWQGAAPIRYQVTVEIGRFELDAADEIHLDARWNIIDRPDLKTLYRESSFIRRTLEHEDEKKIDYTMLTQLMSEMVGDLSREIATKLEPLR